jgi:hypothetical protein
MTVGKKIKSLFRKKEVDLIKRISIYISLKHQQLIIAPLNSNNAGTIYEQEKCFISDYPIDTNELGSQVTNHLNIYSIKDKNLYNAKASEWPAFKHSKVKTIKAFEEFYIRISVHSVNSSNLILEISGVPSNNNELTVNSSISFNAKSSEIGKRVLKVFEACITGKLS